LGIASCDKCEVIIDVAKGFLHCTKCREDYCMDCGKKRENMPSLQARGRK